MSMRNIYESYVRQSVRSIYVICNLWHPAICRRSSNQQEVGEDDHFLKLKSWYSININTCIDCEMQCHCANMMRT